ncbi:PREDICTED: beta-1,6-galactosyltransferase GALT29A-like [Ipomoea nil]|uniref:beta-1,6-galactosyltransferase GALT29A-like n=1 Tax=Ipomoea nil TaxID=35883 RepID=UPI0009008E64|nr:PREDICTED: beta-1,6-galactosyltransferase GALT29A-like [Ipomoea nil]
MGNPFAKMPQVVVFNDTLLKYASMDIGEPQFSKEVDELLRGQLKGCLYSSGPRSLTCSGLWLSFRRYLRDWFRNRKLQTDYMIGLVHGVKVLIDKHNGKSKLEKERYSSCAIVGNSGILLNSEYGKVIDGHDTIEECKNWRTRILEKGVVKDYSLGHFRKWVTDS